MPTGWIITGIIGLFIVFAVFILPHLRHKPANTKVTPPPAPAPPPASGDTTGDTSAAVDGEEADQQQEQPAEDETEDSEMTWQQLVEQADKHMTAFEYDDAISSYDSAIDKLREEKGRDAVELAEVMIKLGRAYQARDDGEDDDDYFTGNYGRALALMEQNWGPFDPRLVPVLQLLIAAEDQNGKPSEAEGLLSRLESIASAQRDATLAAPTATQWSAETSEFAKDGDKEMTENHDAGAAVDAYWSGLESACEKHGNDSLVAADLWFKYGQAVQARDDNDDDEEASTPDSYMRALAIVQQHLGPYSERLIPVLYHLISFYDQVGLYNKADGYIRRLRTIARHKAQEQAAHPATPPAA
jgi:tetratricopeptide (TPR) repeat protein